MSQFKILMRIIILKILIFFSITSCKSGFSTKEFKLSEIPEAPNYELLSSWAAHPYNDDSLIDKYYSTEKSELKADIFYIYPTLLTSKENDSWNSDIFDTLQNNRVKNIAIQYQASAWANAGRVFSPFYRQVHYRSFFEPYTSNGGIDAGKIAFQDIKNAFDIYLEKFNNGRPIIIVGHSQGAFHAKNLLKEYFDGKELQNQLIAAYLAGIYIDENEFTSINHLNGPNQINGFVNWNTFRMNKKPKKGKHPAYFSWKKNQYVINPITWNTDTITSYDQHKGMLYIDNKIYSKNVRIKVYDGIVWSTIPKKASKNIFFRLINNYHFADINLFWKDISENASNRVKYFIQQRTK